MVNIIFEDVPLSSTTKKSLNLIIDSAPITWIQLFRFLSDKTGLDYRHFCIQYRNKRYPAARLWFLHPFELCDSNEDFIFFQVSLYSIKN